MEQRKIVMYVITIVLAIIVGLTIFFIVTEVVDTETEGPVRISIFDYTSREIEEIILEKDKKEETTKLRKIYKDLVIATDDVNPSLTRNIAIVFENGDEISIEIGEKQYCHVKKAGENEYKAALMTDELFEYVNDLIK